MDREYIVIPKTKALPDSSTKRRQLNDSFWIDLVHSHLLRFLKEYNKQDLTCLLEEENRKETRKHTEDLIKDYIYDWLEKYNKQIFRQGIIINREPKVKYNQTGFYDLKFQHSDWADNVLERKKYYCIECKNLKNSQTLINEYVYVESKNDGGIYRYFNGKYAQSQSFGGMLGFVLEGETTAIKTRIIDKIENTSFDIIPEGDLIRVEQNSIAGNDFTFNTIHKRNNNEFLIYHMLFNLQ